MLEDFPLVKRVVIVQVVVTRQQNRRLIYTADLLQERLQHRVGYPSMVENIAHQKEHISTQARHRVHHGPQGAVGQRMAHVISQVQIGRMN